MLTLLPKTLTRILLAAVAAVAALAFSPASHATAYVLTYDPDYPPIPGLAWRATATLFIPDLCSSVVGTQTLNGGSALLPPQNTFGAVADCAGIELRDTVLFLHQSGNPLNVYDQLNIGDYLADADGNSSPGFDIETQELFEVDFVAGEAVDFRTSMSLRLAAPTVDAVFAPVASYFMLSLGATPAGVSLCNLEAAPQLPAVGCTAASTYVGTGDPTLQITITRIPEPGSLALALGALGAAAFSRRKRAAPPAHASLPG